MPFAVGGYIAAACWFTSSTSSANPAITVARSLTSTFAGIDPSCIAAFVGAQLVGGALGFLVVRLLYPPATMGSKSTRRAPSPAMASPAVAQVRRGLALPELAVTALRTLRESRAGERRHAGTR